jgi:hypothetical protein
MPSAMEFLVRHGYVVLFVTVLAEQIGLPVPSVLSFRPGDFGGAER